MESALAYSLLDYHSHANWNIIRNFQHPVSFIQNTDGYGLEASLKARFRLKTYWSVYLQSNYGYWETGTGTDVLYMGNGHTPVTRFNGAARKTLAWVAGWCLDFEGDIPISS